MKVTKSLSLLGSIFVLSTAAACASDANNAVNSTVGSDSTSAPTQGDSLQDSSASRSTPESTGATETNQPTQTANKTTESQKPATKTDTISIEGEKSEVTLKLHSVRLNDSKSFITYFPANDFVPESASSGEGTGIRFYYNVGGNQNEDVYVSVSFLNWINNLKQLEKFVTGKGGLIQSNQWKVVNRTEDVPYSWAKEKIVFEQRQGGENISGEIYLGEAEGKVFYVITHYPAEYADGFAPRANFILKNLQVGG